MNDQYIINYKYGYLEGLRSKGRLFNRVDKRVSCTKAQTALVSPCRCIGYSSSWFGGMLKVKVWCPVYDHFHTSYIISSDSNFHIFIHQHAESLFMISGLYD